MLKEKVSYNKTKIVATVGPASNSPEMLRALVKEGVDVFRLNFSHGTHADHQKVIDAVRQINDELGTTVALLLDLQGPKIRIQEVQPNVELERGQSFTITRANWWATMKLSAPLTKTFPLT